MDMSIEGSRTNECIEGSTSLQWQMATNNLAHFRVNKQGAILVHFQDILKWGSAGPQMGQPTHFEGPWHSRDLTPHPFFLSVKVGDGKCQLLHGMYFVLPSCRKQYRLALLHCTRRAGKPHWKKSKQNCFTNDLTAGANCFDDMSLVNTSPSLWGPQPQSPVHTRSP